jgi:serine/threonine protein phosphatase PrpC
MTSRNDRDWKRDQSARPPVCSDVKVSRSRGTGRGRPLQFVWHWSRLPLRYAASIVRSLVFRPSPCLLLHAGSRCVKGPVRDANEDRCYADWHQALFIVADGMGGHTGGERASQTVMEVIAAELSGILDDGRALQAELADAMRKAVFRANRELMELGRTDARLHNMGATAVIGIVRHSQLLLCSVGDSRAYLLRQNELQQLTIDDTLVQGLVSAGALTVGEAAKHPMRHVLVHSVGSRRLQKYVQVEVHGLRAGDRLLFATDGLTDVVPRDELAALLAQQRDSCATAAALADYALQAGSRDNVTCIVVDLFESLS